MATHRAETHDPAEEPTSPPQIAALPPRSALERPRIEKWVDLPADEYNGYRCLLWINYPKSHKRQLEQGGDEDTMRRLLSEIVIAHNQWPDDQGDVLPAPSDPTFWEQIDDHLLAVIGGLIFTAPLRPPVSMLPPKRP